ncbi:hypothetical protein F4561_000628 [Lipingzhangella halophila]|uniref:Mce-associated membrane protein n=1 Tax=Lipingzhangella halophila TaxID=1783352 RepID=A0A7W7RD63_9ACTN|nr:hypothetical protein [Lipingzhangella halophila]MBB4929808.1 hypothetical protein [Lipingzhangella halophila]
MPKTLPEGAQRLVFGGLVVVLVAFGIYLSLGGFGGGSGGEGQQADEGSPRNGQDSGDPATAAPSPIETTDTKDMEVLEWFPFSEDEFKAAAATAQGYAEAYGTIDYTKSPEEYYKPMEELATDDFAESVEESSGAGALWQERAEEEIVTEGRANVESVRSFDDESIIFVVKSQSVPEGDNGDTEDLGDFAITVVKSGGEWGVYDFQPADVGNLGEG